MKTLKQLLDQVNGEAGFDIPQQYVGSTDSNIAQLVAIANRSAIILRDMRLQYLVRHAELSLDVTTQGYTTDGRITSLNLPDDFYALVPDTTYQSGRIDNAILPTSAPIWAYLVARMGTQTVPVRCRFIQGKLMVFLPPLPTTADTVGSGLTLEFEYVSKYTIRSTGVFRNVNADQFTADTDVWLLDDPLIELDIKWRYKREKGLDWQGDQQDFARYSNELRGRDAGACTIGWPDRDVSMTNPPYTNLWVE